MSEPSPLNKYGDMDAFAFRGRLLRVLEQVETDGFDFDGERCPMCGQIDGESCCPICLAHNGGKLGGIHPHEPRCELAALIREIRGR